MGRCFALPQLLVSGVQRVVHLVDFQNLVAAQYHERFIYRQAQHFIRGKHRSFANAAAFAVLWRVVGDAQGA